MSDINVADIKITVDSKRLEAALQKATRACKNMRPIYEEIGQIVERSIGLNFRAGGRPKPWEPLSDGYLKSKMSKRKIAAHLKGKKRVRSNKILVDSGTLKNSITYVADNGGVEIGTNIEDYPAVHQFGSKKRNIPARPYLLLQDDDERKIVNAIDDYIMEGFK